MSSKIKIQDSNGQKISEVNQPTAVFDQESGSLHKIGEYKDVLEYYNKMVSQYTNNGFSQIAEDIVLFELPKDQETVDKVFQTTGYIQTLYQQTQKH